jgi:addiction module HigA family antidote
VNYLDYHSVNAIRAGARKPTHPGAILRHEYLAPLGIVMTITDLSSRLGVSRKYLSAVLNERAGETPDMALRLSRAFNTTPDLWMNMQKGHDL